MHALMTILLAMQPVATATPPSPADPVATDPEIVVTAEKFAKWRGYSKRKDGQWRCKTRLSSGDKAIDAISCDTLVACQRERDADYDAMLKLGDKTARQKAGQYIMQQVGACMTERRKAALIALRDQRRASKP